MGAVKATVEGDGSAGGRPVKFHVFTQGSPGDYRGSPSHENSLPYSSHAGASGASYKQIYKITKEYQRVVKL
eukprot:5530482-Pyramimonas_sp.AAC.1